MDHASRLLRVIQNNQSNSRKEERSRLLKRFEIKKFKESQDSPTKDDIEEIECSVPKKGDPLPSDGSNIVSRVSNSSSNNIDKEFSLCSSHSINLSSDCVDKMEVENNTKIATKESNDHLGKNCDMYGGKEIGISSNDTSELTKISDERPLAKKCLEKEVRPPDANLIVIGRDSFSTVSTRSSLEPINEEVNDRESLENDNDSSIELEELDAFPRASRERSSSLLSSARSSLEPIHEDIETMEVDAAPATPDDVDDCVDVVKQAVKRKSSRNSKSPLETITEERHETGKETNSLVLEKLPLTYPSKSKDFTWFDLQSPMIKPSRKRRLVDDIDDIFLSSSDELNSSCDDVTLPYSVHDYRRSVINLCGPGEDERDALESSPKNAQSSASENNSGDETKHILADLRSRVQRHESSIRKISEALHASRGVNANLNEHLIHCHRNLLVERQSRQLILEEIDRLERGAFISRDSHVSSGNLVVNHITLLLKSSESQTSTEEPCDEEFHFICLLKCPSGRLAPSDIVSVSRHSRRGSIEFRAKFSLSQVPSDFVIHLELYAMTLIRRSNVGTISNEPVVDDEDDDISITSLSSSMSLPGHSVTGGGVKRLRFIKKLLTPSKSTKRISESVDNSVCEDDDDGWRTTGFSVLASVKLTKNTVNQNNYFLGRIPNLYPLTGEMKMNISLDYGQDNTEERGFLSVFSHVGGFGSWQRLWCVLKPNKILMWRYPNEEASGTDHLRCIELNQCISDRVALASKDTCFRPQTLVLKMAPTTDDGTEPNQLLLSADTKADRLVWCNKINRCLNCLRSWNPAGFDKIRQRFRDK